MKKNLRILISLLVGVLLIVVWLRFVDTDEMAKYLRRIDLSLMLISALCYIIAYLLRALRWKVILDTVEKTKYYEVISLFFVGMFVNYLIPIRAGEFAKSIFLKKMKGTKISKSLPTVLIDKIMDLFPIILIFVLLPFVPALKITWGLIVLIAILFISFLFLMGILVFSASHERQVISFLHKIMFWLPKRFEEQAKAFIDRFVVGVSEAKQGKNVFPKMILFTILAVLFDGLFLYSAFRAFNHPILFISAVYGYALMNLSYILPSPPGQVGSQEFISLLIFHYGLGIEANLIGAVIAFTHVMTGFLIFFIGIASLGVVGIKLTDLLMAKNDENDENGEI